MPDPDRPAEWQPYAPADPAPVWGSDLVVDLLARLGIEYVAFNPGATFRGLHDSLVNYAPGRPAIVECLHEEIAVAVAHGYAKAAGRPMAVAVHDVVGLQHATMAIYNAWCDRVPLLVLGATGPMDATKRRPWIDWIHTANPQATQVRDYTKWDDQPATIPAVPESLARAYQLTTSAPAGPVYVCLDHEIQEGPVPAGFAPGDPARFAAPTPLSPDPAAVARVADGLLAAHRPVILADWAGRSRHAVDLLVELAELLSIPVIDQEGGYNKVALNFPTRHPLNLSPDRDRLLAEADFVLGLETRDLFGSLHEVRGRTGEVHARVPETATTVLVSVDYLATRAWSSDHQRMAPVDLHVASGSAPFLDALLPLVRDNAGDAAGARAAERGTALARRSEEIRAEDERTAAGAASARPLSRAYLAKVLGELTDGYDRVLANGHLGGWVHRLWRIDHTDAYLGGSGGGGLGYGLGASIGVALAHRGSDKLIINIQSDGDALFTPAALWTIAHYRLPILTVMDDNRAYHNSVEHAERVAKARGRPVARSRLGTAIDDPAPDLAALARSFGIHADGPVEDPRDLSPVLARAIDVVVRERRPALIDVITEN